VLRVQWCLGDPRHRDPRHRARVSLVGQGLNDAQSETEELTTPTTPSSCSNISALAWSAARPAACVGRCLAIDRVERNPLRGRQSGSGKSMMANAVMRLLPNEATIDGGS
jgi:hypothetical protein